MEKRIFLAEKMVTILLVLGNTDSGNGRQLNGGRRREEYLCY